jgi:hypothetical protein
MGGFVIVEVLNMGGFVIVEVKNITLSMKCIYSNKGRIYYPVDLLLFCY